MNHTDSGRTQRDGSPPSAGSAGSAVETVARFLEDFARKVEEESSIPMLPKNNKSWIGFTYDAQELLSSLDRLIRQFADPGNRPGPYTVLTRDALHMVMDAHHDSVLWSEDREACEVAAACMNAQLPNTKDQAQPSAASDDSMMINMKQAQKIVLDVEALSEAFHFYMPASVSKLKLLTASPNEKWSHAAGDRDVASGKD